jgi:hypothetical protein
MERQNFHAFLARDANTAPAPPPHFSKDWKPRARFFQGLEDGRVATDQHGLHGAAEKHPQITQISQISARTSSSVKSV